jgi:hypothetical protein
MTVSDVLSWRKTFWPGSQCFAGEPRTNGEDGDENFLGGPAAARARRYHGDKAIAFGLGN